MAEPEVSFAGFFEEVWGHAPFPWQRRLAERLAVDGRWPEVLDLPTGSGKTAAVDIALFDFLRDGGERAPRRIVVVADRKVIPDQVARRADRLRQGLLVPRGPNTAELARRLRAIVGRGMPPGGAERVPLLQVAILRGATARDDAWARYPHVPVIGAGTVDQVGSRLLFRGLGLSDGARPIHAGLVGCDTLLLLDDLHRVQPFASLLRQIQRIRAGFITESPVTARFGFCQLRATPGTRHESFGLESDDRGVPELARRLAASKPARLARIAVSGDESRRCTKLAQAAVNAAITLARRGKNAIAIVVNRTATARQAAARLVSHDEVVDSALLTGRMRPLDQHRVVRGLRHRVVSRREEVRGARPFVLVTTQCIEVGTDFDFDGLVTECASLDALERRFGRLDRRGTRTAEAVILNRSDRETGRDPIYGDALADTWAWLHQIASAATGSATVDMGVDALEPLLPKDPELLAAMRPPESDTGVILPAHLDLWAQTRPVPHVDPDVPTYLHGIADQRERAADLQVVWRDDVPDPTDPSAAALAGDRLEAVPPGTLEALPLPPWAARAWLAQQETGDLCDVDGLPAPDVSAPDRLRGFYVRTNDRWQPSVSAAELRPGRTVVVPSGYGGLARSKTFDPSAREPVDDLGDAVQLLQRGRPMIRLRGELGPRVFGQVAVGPTSSHETEDVRVIVRDAVEAMLDSASPRADIEPWWRRVLLRALSENRNWHIVRVRDGGWLVAGSKLDPEALRELTAGHLGDGDDLAQVLATEATTEGTMDSGCMTGASVGLADHLAGVAEWARSFGIACGLDQPLVTALSWAGRIHDAGKADPRFQLLLHGDPVRAAQAAERGELLAKSRLVWFDREGLRLAAEHARYPRGQRHELVSLDMMERSEELRARIERDGADPELVAHLVASHHGWCRPFAPVPAMEQNDDDHVELHLDGLTLRGRTLHRRERLDSGVSRRFQKLNQCYGWHELAYLEAILRLADMRGSEHEQRGADA